MSSMDLPPPLIWFCRVCTKEFTSKSKLHRHKVVHDSVRTFTSCDYCEKSYSQLSTLYDHIRNIHNQTPKFTRNGWQTIRRSCVSV